MSKRKAEYLEKDSVKKIKAETLFSLPKDMVYSIMYKLDPDDILERCRTSKEWNSLCNDNDFWAGKFVRDFPDEYKRRMNQDSNKVIMWKKYYKVHFKKMSQYREKYYILDLGESAPTLMRYSVRIKGKKGSSGIVDFMKDLKELENIYGQLTIKSA